MSLSLETKTTMTQKLDKYRQLAQQWPDDLNVRLALAETAHRRGFKLEALEGYQRVLSAVSVVEAHLAMAQMYLAQSLEREAVEELVKLFGLDPGYAEAHVVAKEMAAQMPALPDDLKAFVDAGCSQLDIHQGRIRLDMQRSSMMRESQELSQIASQYRDEPLFAYYTNETKVRLQRVDDMLRRLGDLEQERVAREAEQERQRKLELARQQELEEAQRREQEEAARRAEEEAAGRAAAITPTSLDDLPDVVPIEGGSTWTDAPLEVQNQDITGHGELISMEMPAPELAEPPAVEPEPVASIELESETPEVPEAPEVPSVEEAPAAIAASDYDPPVVRVQPVAPLASASTADDILEDLTPLLDAELPTPDEATAYSSNSGETEAHPGADIFDFTSGEPLGDMDVPGEIYVEPPVAAAPEPAPVAPPPPPAPTPPPTPPPAPVVEVAPAKADPSEFYQARQAEMDNLIQTLAKTRGVTSIYVLTRHGLRVGEVSRDAIDPKAISELVVEALGFLESYSARPQYWVLECSGGIVVMQSIDDNHVLVAIGQAGANFGALRYTMDKVRPNFAHLVEGAPL